MKAEVRNWVKKNKLHIIVTNVAALAALETHCAQPSQTAPESPNIIRPGLTGGARLTGYGLTFRIGWIGEGRNPIFCGDGRPLKNTVYDVKELTIVIDRESGPRYTLLDGPKPYPPAAVCRFR